MTHAGEKARITAAGGFVDFGRVNGNLALSRAIGDFEFKKTAELPPEQQIVTAYPDVTEHEITADDEFVVIACDGKYLSHICFLKLSLSNSFQVYGTVNLHKQSSNSSEEALWPNRSSHQSVKT